MSDLKPFRKPGRSWSGIFFRLLLLLVALVAAAGGAVWIIYGKMADRYDLAKLGAMRQRSVVLDIKGREIGKLHGENRVVVPLKEVSSYFIKALLAREDARFYEHDGVDYIGVLRAIKRDFIEKKAAQGASTLTMQLARNSFDDLSEKTMTRKLVEVMLARRIEHQYSKDQILELYVNRIFFGSGVYGIERASKVYFNKHAADLTLGESAMLAGIIRSPNRFSPLRNWKGALEERNTVLDRMALKGFLTPTQVEAARAEDMAVAAIPMQRTQENYMMEAIRRDLDAILTSEDIEDGGLRIYTTIDRDVQTASEKALEDRLRSFEGKKGYNHLSKAAFDKTWDGSSELGSTPYLQGATITINNDTGGIVAVVGGRDFLQSRFDRAEQGQRTIGSTIKPFVYACAFQQGLLPGVLVEDAPIRPGELRENVIWSPQNSDGKFLGMQPASVGLVQSRNAMTVRVGERGGLDNLVELLKTAGINVPANPSPQIFIGNTGASLRALTTAMTIFPNNGVRRRPFLVQRIEDANGQQVYSTPVLDTEVLPSGIALITHRLLEQVVSSGTASAGMKELGFKAKAGGKTGTTNDYKDAWFIGFSGNLTTGVWVGFDQPQTIGEGAYGGKMALPIWVDVMNAALASVPQSTVLKAEPLLTKATLCRITGLLATDGCTAAGHAYQEELPYEMVPQTFCTLHEGATASPAAPERTTGNSGGGFWDRVKRWFR